MVLKTDHRSEEVREAGAEVRSGALVDLALLGLVVGVTLGGVATAVGNVTGPAVVGVMLGVGALLGSVLAVPTLLRARGR